MTPGRTPQGRRARQTRRSAITHDVAERWRIQEALRDSHDRLQALIQSSPVAIYSLDPKGVVQTWNPAAERMFGWRAEEVVGRLLPIVPDHKQEEFSTLRARAMRGERLAAVRAHRRRRDGSPIEIDIWTSPLHDAEGRVAGIMAVVTDATERNQAAQQLRVQAAELSALIEIGQALSHLTEPAEVLRLIHAAAGRVLDNRNLFIALHDEASQSISFPVYTIDGQARPAPSRPFGNGATEYVIRTRTPLLIPRGVTAALRARSVDIIGREARSFLAVPMLVGDRAIGVICVQDYEREGTYDAVHAEILSTFASQAAIAIENARLYATVKQDLAEGQKSEQRLRLQAGALEAVANAIVITDRGGTIQWVNPAFARMTGYAAGEVIGQTPRLFKSGKQDGAFYEQLWSTILAGDVWRGEIVNRRKDGSLYVEDQTITPLRNETGQITHFIAIKQDVTERKEAEAQLHRQLQYITAMNTVGLTIAGSLELRTTLALVLDEVITQLGGPAADILLLNPDTRTLDYAAERGFRTHALRHSHVRLGEGYAGQAAVERRVIQIADLTTSPGAFTRAALLPAEGFVAYYAAPLISKGTTKGVLEVFFRTPHPADPDWLEFLQGIAVQAAIAIDNATLFSDLQRTTLELGVAYDATLEGWVRALDLRHKETEGHTLRVTELTGRLARATGVEERDLQHIRRGALLHDIGKIGIPDSILLKAGPLTDEEWEVMRRHPVHAHQFLSPIAFLRPALDIPYCHHEKWDGSGYPRGLRGEEIPLAARLFAVVDVWDALTSDREYRPAWPQAQALDYIKAQAGIHFDPKVVEAFVILIETAAAQVS